MISVVLILTLVGFILGSFYLGYNIQLDEFSAYRSRATFTHILFSLLSSLVGGWMFFGLSAMGYEAGVVGYIIGLAYSIGLILLGYQSGKIKEIMRTNNYDTLDEYIGGQYGTTAQALTSFVNLVFFLTVLAAQFVAMTALLSTFVQGEQYIIFILAAVVVIGYTVAAGFKGVLLTDVWQFTIISIIVIASFVLVVNNGGIAPLSNLPSSHFTGTSFGTVFVVAVLLFFPPSILVRTDLWQRISAAKSVDAVRKAFYWTSPLLLVFYVVLTSLGMFARAYIPAIENTDKSILKLILSIVGNPGTTELGVLPSLILSFFAVGILAALISTIDTNLNVVSVAFSKLINADMWSEYESLDEETKTAGSDTEKELLTRTRIITGILGIAGALMAVLIPDIVDLIVSAGAIILIFLPSVLGALFYNHSHSRPTSLSIALGFISFIIALIFLGDPAAAFTPGFLVSTIVYLGVRWVGR